MASDKVVKELTVAVNRLAASQEESVKLTKQATKDLKKAAKSLMEKLEKELSS